MQISYIVDLMVAAIFNRTFTVVMCLAIIKMLKIRLSKINEPLLVEAINTVLLAASTVSVVMRLAEIWNAYFSAGEYLNYVFTSRLFGSYWWAAVALLTRSILLPQMLWFRRLRRSFIAIFIITLVWGIIDIPIIVTKVETGYNFWIAFVSLKSGVQMLSYGLLLSAVYLFLKRKKIPSAY